MLKYMKKYWIFAVLAAGFMIAEVTVDMWQPRLMAKIVDEGILGIGGDGNPNIPLITTVGIRMILVVLLGGLCGMLSGTFANVCSQNYANDVRKKCFERIMHLSFQQTDKFTTGSLITRITNDVSQVERLVQQSVRGFVRSMMLMVVGTFTLLSLDTHFLTVIACAFPLVILEMVLVLRKASPLFTELQEKLDKMNTVIQENVNGVRVVKAFVQEEREEARFNESNQNLVDTQLKVLILLSYLRPAMNIILNLATVALIKIGAVQVEGGFMQPGQVMAAVTYIAQILGGMMMLAMIFQMMTRGMASAKRLREILDAAPVIKDGEYVMPQSSAAAAETPAITATHGSEPGTAHGSEPGTPRGSIEFKNVSFSYPDVKEGILHDITLKINPGETFGIIGATGSGKSTLANLVARFYDPTSGQVLIDGVDAKDYKLKDLRSKVTYVTQKNELFSTTIGENIAIGKDGATEEEIKEAAVNAQADNFIMDQQDGYKTAVAEKGASLSGGQKQRIAIARALLKHSEIMIFDDSTSALDLKTEAALYDALDKYYSDVTKIVIAQRVATIKYADRIAVIEGGQISACGTHEELMKASPTYRDICESQMKKGGAA